MLALELFRKLITLSALWASLKRKETPAASKLGLGNTGHLPCFFCLKRKCRLIEIILQP